MESKIKDALLDALEVGKNQEGKKEEDAKVKNLLTYLLIPEEVDVFDAMVGKLDGKEEKKQKECKAKDPKKCWKHGFAADILNKDKKQKVRKAALIDPQPTKQLRELQDLRVEFMERMIDIQAAFPDSVADTDSMEEDIMALKKEAKIKNLKTFAPFGQYLAAWQAYDGYKEEVRQQIERTEELLNNKQVEKAEQAIAALQNKEEEIIKAYEAVQKAYEDVCSELEKIVRDKDGGSQEGGRLEVERQGYGMINGEDVKTYQKRMKSLLRTKEVPETIKKIDDIVGRAERRWRSVAGVSQGEFDVIKANWRETVDNLMKRSAFASNHDMIGINGILESYYKSAHELAEVRAKATMRGGNEESLRHRMTRKAFGTQKGMAAEEYEKYGCLHHIVPNREDSKIGGAYGKNVIRWKKYETVATMCCSDSLCLAYSHNDYVTPCLVSNPSPACFNPENRDFIDELKKRPLNIGIGLLCGKTGTPYIELQFHGAKKYGPESISSITLETGDDVRCLSNKAVEAITEYKIPVYIGDKQIRVEDYRKKGQTIATPKAPTVHVPFKMEGGTWKIDSKGQLVRGS